jgi:hypothetical protein
MKVPFPGTFSRGTMPPDFSKRLFAINELAPVGLLNADGNFLPKFG